MSNSRYPTLVQVLPLFHFLIQKQSLYLNLDASANPGFVETLPVYDLKPKTLVTATFESRKKLLKYFSIANSPDALQPIATSKLILLCIYRQCI
jgi:hypothetical protein